MAGENKVTVLLRVTLEFDGSPDEKDAEWYAEATKIFVAKKLDLGEGRIDGNFRYRFTDVDRVQAANDAEALTGDLLVKLPQNIAVDLAAAEGQLRGMAESIEGQLGGQAAEPIYAAARTIQAIIEAADEAASVEATGDNFSAAREVDKQMNELRELLDAPSPPAATPANAHQSMLAIGWPEDSTHENGNYQNRCRVCERIFIGHKRRVLCKVCDKNLTYAAPASLENSAAVPFKAGEVIKKLLDDTISECVSDAGSDDPQFHAPSISLVTRWHNERARLSASPVEPKTGGR